MRMHSHTCAFCFPLIPQIICILRAYGLLLHCLADIDLILGAWELRLNEIWTIVFVSLNGRVYGYYIYTCIRVNMFYGLVCYLAPDGLEVQFVSVIGFSVFC